MVHHAPSQSHGLGASKGSRAVSDEPAEVNTLRAQLSDREEELRERERHAAEQASKIQELGSNMSGIESTLQQSYRSTLDELIRHTAGLDRALKKARLENEELREQMCREKEARETMQRRASYMEDQLDGLRRTGNSAARILGLEDELRGLSSELKVKDQALSELEATCNRQQDTIQQLEGELADLEAHLNKSYETTLNEYVKQIQHLGTSLETSQQKVHELKAQLQQAQEREQQGPSKDKTLDSHLESHRATSSVSITTVTESSSVASSEHVADLESRLSVADHMSDYLQASVSNVEKDKQVLVAKVRSLKSQVEELTGKLRARESELTRSYHSLTQTSRLLSASQSSLRLSREERVSLLAAAEHAGRQLEQLQEQLETRELELAKKEFALAETSRVLRFTQGKMTCIKDEREQDILSFDGQLADKSFRLHETERVLKYAQQTLDKASETKQVNESKMEKQICHLELRLAESVRLVRLLEGSLSMTTAQKAAQDIKANALKDELTAVQLIIEQRSRQGTKADAECKELDDDSGKLTSRASTLQSRLEVTNNVAAYMQESLSRAERVKVLSETKISELESQIIELKDALRSKDDALQAVACELSDVNQELLSTKTVLVSTKKDKEENESRLEQLVCEKDVGLAESDRVLKSALHSLSTMQEEKQVNEWNLQSQVRELEFRLTESQRILKFLQHRMTMTAEEKAASEAKVQSLEDDLSSTKKLVQAHEESLSLGNESDGTGSARLEQLEQIARLESDLAVTKRVAEFLQATLTRVEAEKREAESQTKSVALELDSLKAFLQAKDSAILEKEFKLNGLGRVLKFTQHVLAKTRDEKHQAEQRLGKEVFDNAFRLTETQRVLHFAQSSLTKIQQEKQAEESRLEKRILDLEYRLTESGRVLRFLQTRLASTEPEKAEHQSKAKALEAELRSMRKVLEENKESLETASVSNIDHATKMADMTRRVSQMEADLAVARNLTDHLNDALCDMKEERKDRASRSEFLETELSRYQTKLEAQNEEIARLQFQVAESNRIAMFLQNKASQADMESRLNASKVQELEERLSALAMRLHEGEQDFSEVFASVVLL